jgi:hypothetical protein
LRKLAAILLLLILLFNLFGYRLVISALENKADDRLEARIDNRDYDESQLMEMRVPLNMPYQERYTEFERHYGEIEVDGQAYRYVASKVEGDVLVLKCIINQYKKQFRSLNDNMTAANSAIADTDQPGQPQQQKSFAKSFFSDLFDGHDMFRINTQQAPDCMATYASYTLILPEVVTATPHQPPRFA